MTIRPLPTLLLLILFAACKWMGKSEPSDKPGSVKIKPSTEMPIAALPVTGDYPDDWKIVDSLEQQGLFKSALEKVEAIQARARQDKNGQQVVKAILFRGKYITQLEEDGLTKAIMTIEQEANTARQPEKSVLQSMLGQLYATYLQSQSWKISQRTPIPDGEGGDILTWSAAQIEKRALELYAASVAAEPQLRITPVDQFRDVTIHGQNDTVDNQALRPTLYDLLAHRALEHFANERSYLTEPAYAFQLNQTEAFADASTFIKTAFETRDSSSGKWLAIKILQKIIAAQMPAQRGPGGPALLDADLTRLKFAFYNTTLGNKDELYQNALERLEQASEQVASQAEITHARALHLFNLDGDEKGANAKAAVAMLKAAINRHPGTYGSNLCQNLLNQIVEPRISTNVEQVNLSDKPVLVQIGFKNVKKVWTKVVRTNFEQDKWADMDYDAQFQYLNKLRPIQNRFWDISDPGDYQYYRTELALEALPFGNYYVFVSDNATFDITNGSVAYAEFAVSNIAAVSYTEEGQSNFILANRDSGAPMAGVKLDFYVYNYNSGRRKQQHAGSALSDRDGLAKSNIPLNTSATVRASIGKDTLWVGSAYRNRPGRSSSPRPQVEFFTDRAIYRPGQLVYFKGLLYQRSETGVENRWIPEILPNQSVTVKFYDANYQVKQELKLKSNEFGTFNGVFTAPATGLTGQMSIQAENGASGQAFFSVEEYKRPRFEVTMKPVEGAFRVNEKITVRGEAKNYAGSVVDGAAVRYRVVRVARFPYWDYNRSWKLPPYFNRPDMEVANGEVTTDAAGNFAIEFTAIPDPNIPKKSQPVFNYDIIVDVTDITGETRSSGTSVDAGYIALKVNLALPNDLHIDSLKRVGLSTTNMAGQAQAATGEISVQRLVSPKQFYKSRLWPRPDFNVIPQADFNRLFPDLAWKDEDDPTKWGREDFTRTISFNTANAQQVDLNEGRMQPGWYSFRLKAKDAYGEPVEIERIVRVWNERTRFEKPDAALETSTVEPGETARIAFGGAPEGLHFFFSQEQHGSLLKPEWISSQLKDLSSIEIKVQESDRGGLIGYWFAVKSNRIYGVEQLRINVPWSNKDLDITYETFRDKLAPGQKEEWRLKISGPKKEKVAAEMVAAMYDASLDQFRMHGWSGVSMPWYYSNISISAAPNFGSNGGAVRTSEMKYLSPNSRTYPTLNWFDFPFWGRRLREAMMMRSAPAEPMDGETSALEEVVVSGASSKKSEDYSTFDPEADSVSKPIDSGEKKLEAPPAGIRRNLNETVFFFPELRTDAEGNVILKFTMNEALTRWKLLTYAHTKDLQQAVSVKEVVTQKELMVIANPPRFLRQGDEMEFSAKVSNLSKEKIEGNATLNMLNAASLLPMERDFGLAPNKRIARFSVLPGQSSAISWRIKVPDDFSGAVTWQIFADGGSFRDGEESTIPVISNRMLVTEAMPISVRGNQTKQFVFENLKNSKDNGTLKTHSYSLEFSSNPVWYAVQALPYLMEFPHECSEQIFSRFYANTLASNVVNKMPQIKRVFDRWKGTDAMKSNLSKNQELKYALLEETPWVLEAQSEEQQKQNIALLFDLNRMASEQERAINTLAERQLNSGGWPWFSGGPDSWYVTQYIVTGMMHLEKLGAFNPEKDKTAARMLDKALGYCDAKMEEQYKKLQEQVKQGKAKLSDDHLDGLIIQYLYARSFAPVDRGTEAFAYYLDQATKYWLGKGLYQEGLLALALHRFGNADAAGKIVASLRERATLKDELGMYWPVDWGYYWYQLPVETQALMVEVFGEVSNDKKSVEELRIWLLKNKQTNRWSSTKATAEAVYALLLFGDNWLDNSQPVRVTMGNKPLQVQEYEAGTGYFKQQWNGTAVNKSWADVKVENPNSNIVWGAAYWQYFEDLDKIKDFEKTPLTIVKQLFTEENSDAGPVLKPIAEGQTLKRGDKIKVRIEIRVDRAMEFVHLKDMRAAGFEPVNVLSGYRWQGGLGYYESTKDLATHFFIDYLPRGTYVFEYPLVVSLRGDMSNGISTMQCMYAPEFTSHSKGLRVRVE